MDQEPDLIGKRRSFLKNHHRFPHPGQMIVTSLPQVGQIKPVRSL
jgi:hypothetical protein